LPNHRQAIATGFLDAGTSGILILPTGTGKTTLSELKIAATLNILRHNGVPNVAKALWAGALNLDIVLNYKGL